MKVNVFNGKTWIYACSVEARVGMKIIQGVIKRITKGNVWVESSVPGYEETGYPVSQPSMTLALARSYLQYDVEELGDKWDYVNHFFTERAAARYACRYQEKSGNECRYVLREKP